MNVPFTDVRGMYVCLAYKGANANGYRMFDAVLVIFTKTNYYNPNHHFAWSTERNQTCLFLSLYLSLKT